MVKDTGKISMPKGTLISKIYGSLNLYIYAGQVLKIKV